MPVRKLAVALFLINGLQLILGAGILIGLQFDLIRYSELLLDLSILLVLLGSLLSLAGLFSVTRYQQNNYRESLDNLEKLNVRLREQRHDYLNQIQIVYGLLELEEYENARDYLRPVFKDIMKVNRAMKTSQPAVNALLQAKLEEAEQQGIDFYLEVATQLKELELEAWEFCKILANLIDNAVTAASIQPDNAVTAASMQDDKAVTAASMQDGKAVTVTDMQDEKAVTATGMQEGERWVRVRMEEKPEGYRILVANNGPQISEQQKKMIFTRGYTTKKGEGHGMGLAIVSSILKEAGGSIQVESSAEETTFLVLLPRQTEILQGKVQYPARMANGKQRL